MTVSTDSRLCVPKITLSDSCGRLLFSWRFMVDKMVATLPLYEASVASLLILSDQSHQERYRLTLAKWDLLPLYLVFSPFAFLGRYIPLEQLSGPAHSRSPRRGLYTL